MASLEFEEMLCTDFPPEEAHTGYSPTRASVKLALRVARRFDQGATGRGRRRSQQLLELSQEEHGHEVKSVEIVNVHGVHILGAEFCENQAFLHSPAFTHFWNQRKLRFSIGFHERFVQSVRNMMALSDDAPPLERWHEGLHDGAKGADPSKSFRASKRALSGLRGCANSEVSTETAAARIEDTYQSVYEDFLLQVVLPHLRTELAKFDIRESTFFCQQTACLRIQPPSAHPLTSPHKDAMYGHQPGQLNFWIPLTRAFGCNSLFAESFPGKADFQAFEVLEPGCMIRFYGSQCLHFTEANTTPITRVSLDFRVVPGQWFETDFAGSRADGKQKFTSGEGQYYKCFVLE